MSTLRSTNTSRAYWELKAEQVMDRVFHPDSDPAPELQETIEVDVREATPTPASSAAATSIADRLRAKQWVVAAVLLCSLGASVGLWQGWSTAQRQLRLERHARLLAWQPQRRTCPKHLAPADTPVEEAWIAQLPPLPRFQPPWNPRPAQRSRSPSCRNWSAWSNPGQRGSAHLPAGASSSNALVGGTDRQQRLAPGGHQSDGAVIERNGMRRRVSIRPVFDTKILSSPHQTTELWPSPQPLWQAAPEAVAAGLCSDASSAGPQLSGPWRLLLLGDGSPTRHLQSLTGQPVQVEVIAMQADQQVASEAPQEVEGSAPLGARRQVWLAAAPSPWPGPRAGGTSSKPSATYRPATSRSGQA